MNVAMASASEVRDDDWVCSCFIIPDGPNWSYESERRYYTTAERKVGGSGLGEGRVINMPPMPSEFADPPMGFGVDGVRQGDGMGVFGSEILDDNLDVIHIRPGVARYSSLTRFYLNAMQEDAIKTSEYGWFDKIVHAVSGAVGYLLLIPFKIVGSAWDVLKSAMSNDDTNRYSYYYLAPAAYSYWRAVDNIVNDYALRSGLIPGAAYANSYDDGAPANKELSKEDIDYFVKHIPGVYRGGKFGVPRIDVLAISCRHQLLMNRREEYIAKKLDAVYQKDLNEAYLAKWEEIMMNHNPWGADEQVKSLDGIQKVGAAMLGANSAMREQYNRIVHSNLSEVLKPPEETSISTVVNDDTGVVDAVYDTLSSLLGADEASAETVGRVSPEMDDAGFVDNWREVVRGGAEWVSFAVDQITETKITINNDSGPSGLASMINGAVSAARGVQFNIAGGNIGDGMAADMIEGVIKTGKAAFNGLASAFVGGMPSAILGGKAFIDIPDVYQGSSMEFDNMNYSLTSYSTSGHPLAKLRMLMPYFCILALTAPQSGGPASYCPPFLVEVQHKGRAIIQLGMIDSLDVTFGDEDGWDVNDIPNMVKIDFSVVNLSKGFHVPIDPEAALTYRDTGAFALHMSVLAGTALTDRDRSLAYNLKRTIMRTSQKMDRFWSATNWAHMTGSGLRSILSGPLAMAGVYTNRR